MDGRNNQFSPENTQNNRSTNALSTAELNHILQHGVTPEQFAENARQLEAYSRMNAAALQVYLQRQSQQAEQRRQDELRLVQMAQQLASGSQQQLQRQLPPPAPPLLHGHRSSFPQLAAASRTAPVPTHNHGQPFNEANVNNTAFRHWSHIGHSHVPSVPYQQYQPSTSVNEPTSVNQNGYPSLQKNRISYPTGGAGGSTTSTAQTAPPKVVPSFVQKTPLYPQYSGIASTGIQANTGLGGPSGANANYIVHQPYESLNELYNSWVKAHGEVRAAALAREHMQLMQQQRQSHSTVPITMQSTFAHPTTLISTPNLQNQRQFHIPAQVVAVPAASVPLPQTQAQERHSFVPVVSIAGQQAVSQPHPAASFDHAPVLRPSTDNSSIETTNVQRELNNTNVHDGADVQTHNPVINAGNRAVSSGSFASTVSVIPGSQPSSTQSILLGSEDKGTALYTLRGLAASIKRSLNAEKLAASVEPSASTDSPGQKRKRSSSAEVIDTRQDAQFNRSKPPSGETYEQELPPKEEPQPPHLVTEPEDSQSTLPLPEASIPQQETHTRNEFAIPVSHDNSTRNFVPFSTLAGAVSMDNVTVSIPTSHHAATSEDRGVLEDQTQETVLHNHINIPLVPVSQSSFDHLSFSHRTSSPPLTATITLLREEDEVDAKARATPPHPSVFLHEEEVDTQLHVIPSTSDDGLEMGVASGQDQVPTPFDTAPSSRDTTYSEAREKNSSIQEVDASVRHSVLLDSSIGDIDSKLMGNLEADCPTGETRSPERAPAELPRILTEASPIRIWSSESAEASGPSSLPKLSRKSSRKQDFYIAVPPPSEWVLRAKHREAERKALASEKSGQRSTKEYTEFELANRLCPRKCQWNGCQAVLNSMFTLKQHVRRHQSEVKPVGITLTVSCQWKQCRMVCQQSSLLLHLNRHIEKEITCIYDDCDERFSRIKDLAEHEKSEHADDKPPPSAVPRPPDLKSPVTLPQIVPPYMTATRPASKPSITAERHARLGPWTLGMIVGYPATGLDNDGFNTTLRARRPTRLSDKVLSAVATPTTPGIGGSGEMASNTEFLGRSADYDLLEEPSVAPSHIFGDLDSVDVTRGFYDGSNIRGGSPWSAVDDEGSEDGVVQTVLQTDVDSLAVESLL
ncbi:hypothetical protein F5148DRAFT_1208971 [Russula earlei]|uniref:Uncharacterized protein n=1 Tax=Russula earlei TaxID=71964 RepID=A0ACC0U7I0_9AGAM|nr:hypothetical protein F5148DRAFT_1208971 [Russula earlei]